MFSITKPGHWSTLIAALALSACGGGSSDITATDAQIVSDITVSNITALGTGTNRWVGTAGTAPQVSVVIPTPADTTQSGLAAEAHQTLADMNRKLAGKLVLTETSTAPASGGYIQVSYLTAYVPPGTTDYASFCSNVSLGPNQGSTVQPSPNGERNQTVAWVNLGNGHCNVTQDIVSHEFGHALGLGAHFSGFGIDSAISAAYWDVLATLYGNPVLTPATQLVVYRAAS